MFVLYFLDANIIVPMGIIDFKDMREKVYQSFFKFTYNEDDYLVLRRQHAALDIRKTDGKICPIASTRRNRKPSFYAKHILEEDLLYYVFSPQINKRFEEVRRTSNNDVRIKYPHKKSKKYHDFFTVDHLTKISLYVH